MDVLFYPCHMQGAAAAPASKSEAHRRMICAGLSEGEVTLTGYMESADMAATKRCLTALGAQVLSEGDVLTVRGGSVKPGFMPVLDCGESGSTLRFFVPLAMTLAGGGTFRMHGRLGSRPMDVYRDLFVPHGADWRMGAGADGSAELTVYGGMRPGNYELPGNVSSQFVSGLLFALPLLEGDSTLTVKPPVESAGYIRMTIKAIEESGIRLEETAPFAWRIPGFQRYHAPSGSLHGDYSQAAVLLCAAALGHDITVTGLAADSIQGDRAVLHHLADLGATVTERDGEITVRGGDLHGAELDMRDCPDIAPMLALVCQLARGESRLTHCGRLRLKECDRLAATVEILNRLGGCAKAEGDDIVIQGVDKLRGGVTLEDYNDHRMVMLAAVAASVAAQAVTVRGVGALDKSWPEFLRVYESLGGRTA